jgi:hypothetical protein
LEIIAMALHRPKPVPVIAGDTFLGPPPYNHLYVVCSDPALDPARVLLVSVTTWKPKEENCCIIQANEHPFVKHKSCVRYKDVGNASVASIQHLENLSGLKRRAPVSSELLARIRDGACESEYLPVEWRRVLESQSICC